MSENYASIEFFKDVRNRLGVILKQLADIADARGDVIVDNQSTAAKITNALGDFQRPLAEMLNERSQSVLGKTAFRIAVIGEFNAGKSTLINALLGHKILSTSIKPRTAAKTILRYSEEDAYHVTYNTKYEHLNSDEIIYTENLAQDIAAVTSDDADVLLQGKGESVAEQIKEVEIWCNSEFLNREETEIIDTPGLGSVFEHHKVVTYKLIPEMDATLYLFPSDPGLGEDDQVVLNFIRQHISQFLFVMTKIDRLSDEEQEEMLGYSQDVIKNIAQIPVDRVYGVSAQYQIKGQTDKSGFNTFLEELESFLVSSKGIARLLVPLEVAQTQSENLLKNTQLDLERVDDDVETLRAELQQLQTVQQQLEEGKESLIKDVEQKIEEIMSNALDGIDDLPTLVGSAVKEALDNFNKESLKKADVKLQPVISDRVQKWVEAKDKSFSKQTELLQGSVESKLKLLVELVDNMTPVKSSVPRSEITSTQNLSVIGSGRDARFLWGTTLQAGGAFVTGLGALGIASAIATGLTGAFVLFPPILLLLPPLLPILSNLASNEERIREDIKKQLEEPIHGNNVNIFQAIVEGYIDKNGETQPGMRETLRSHFNNWGNNLKAQINNFVDNLVSGQLAQIEKQIDDKENNRFDREQRKDMHTMHGDNLQKISQQLADIGATIQEMSDASSQEPI